MRPRQFKFDLAAFILIKIECGEWKIWLFLGPYTRKGHVSTTLRINVHSEHLCRTVCWLTSDLSLKLNNVWSAISQSSTSPHKSSQYNLACSVFGTIQHLKRISSCGVNWHLCSVVTRGEMKAEGRVCLCEEVGREYWGEASWGERCLVLEWDVLLEQPPITSSVWNRP